MPAAVRNNEAPRDAIPSVGDPGDAKFERLRVIVLGAVQGVGFRPFVYRLARELDLAGWVNNSAQGVLIEVEGGRPQLRQFLLRLETEKPPRSFVQGLESSWLDPLGYRGFEIRPSSAAGEKTALLLPDIATCADCVREIFDPADRRYRYPFTNCTHCGPRFTIIESLPYDRSSTSMRRFGMCIRCEAEYHDPRDRRFHAQPNACPDCGPRLELWDRTGRALAAGDPALRRSAEAIRAGQIVALKGMGGFQLVVTAGNEAAVRRLRELKRREEKPLALMFPSLEAAIECCEVEALETRLLQSPESPIVLLRAKRRSHRTGRRDIADAVAPGNPFLGVMLPCTPLHHLLMADLGFPVVATSGNLRDEPICIDEHEALERLGGIADLFLVHNRSIVRHVDDSIVRVMLGREMVLRRARGYAPLPVQLPLDLPPSLPSPPLWAGERVAEGRERGSRNGLESPGDRETTMVGPPTNPPSSILAVGAHLKNSVALSVGRQVFLSQHIGDLETEPAFAAFRRVIEDFKNTFDACPGLVAADAHPDYHSSRFARDMGLPVLAVQHHYAHVLACMAENELAPPVLGVSWDGAGYGPDGTVWGGEFLRITDDGFERAGFFRRFRLPGGDAAAREPRRSALGLLHELFGGALFDRTDLHPVRAFDASELAVLARMLKAGVNSPVTSSAGRLFDAVASLAGLRQRSHFEGQAAMELEFAANDFRTSERYPFQIKPAETSDDRVTHIIDWAPLIHAVLDDLARATPTAAISAKFHHTLADVVVAMAERAGQQRVVLSGGCFQNRALTEETVRRLRGAGFRPYWHQRIPPNDGGIALGQVVAAWRTSR